MDEQLDSSNRLCHRWQDECQRLQMVMREADKVYIDKQFHPNRINLQQSSSSNTNNAQNSLQHRYQPKDFTEPLVSNQHNHKTVHITPGNKLEINHKFRNNSPNGYSHHPNITHFTSTSPHETPLKQRNGVSNEPPVPLSPQQGSHQLISPVYANSRRRYYPSHEKNRHVTTSSPLTNNKITASTKGATYLNVSIVSPIQFAGSVTKNNKNIPLIISPISPRKRLNLTETQSQIHSVNEDIIKEEVMKGVVSKAANSTHGNTIPYAESGGNTNTNSVVASSKNRQKPHWEEKEKEIKLPASNHQPSSLPPPLLPQPICLSSPMRSTQNVTHCLSNSNSDSNSNPILNVNVNTNLPLQERLQKNQAAMHEILSALNDTYNDFQPSSTVLSTSTPQSTMVAIITNPIYDETENQTVLCRNGNNTSTSNRPQSEDTLKIRELYSNPIVLGEGNDVERDNYENQHYGNDGGRDDVGYNNGSEFDDGDNKENLNPNLPVNSGPYIDNNLLIRNQVIRKQQNGSSVYTQISSHPSSNHDSSSHKSTSQPLHFSEKIPQNEASRYPRSPASHAMYAAFYEYFSPSSVPPNSHVVPPINKLVVTPTSPNHINSNHDYPQQGNSKRVSLSPLFGAQGRDNRGDREKSEVTGGLQETKSGYVSIVTPQSNTVSRRGGIQGYTGVGRVIDVDGGEGGEELITRERLDFNNTNKSEFDTKKPIAVSPWEYKNSHKIKVVNEEREDDKFGGHVNDGCDSDNIVISSKVGEFVLRSPNSVLDESLIGEVEKAVAMINEMIPIKRGMVRN